MEEGRGWQKVLAYALPNVWKWKSSRGKRCAFHDGLRLDKRIVPGVAMYASTSRPRTFDPCLTGICNCCGFTGQRRLHAGRLLPQMLGNSRHSYALPPMRSSRGSELIGRPTASRPDRVPANGRHPDADGGSRGADGAFRSPRPPPPGPTRARTTAPPEPPTSAAHRNGQAPPKASGNAQPKASADCLAGRSSADPGHWRLKAQPAAGRRRHYRSGRHGHNNGMADPGLADGSATGDLGDFGFSPVRRGGRAGAATRRAAPGGCGVPPLDGAKTHGHIATGCSGAPRRPRRRSRGRRARTSKRADPPPPCPPCRA